MFVNFSSMAPKKQKKGKFSRAYDQAKSINVKAQIKYQDLIVKSLVVIERVIEIPREFEREFEEIEARGWDKLTAHLEMAILVILREFYKQKMTMFLLEEKRSHSLDLQLINSLG